MTQGGKRKGAGRPRIHPIRECVKMDPSIEAKHGGPRPGAGRPRVAHDIETKNIRNAFSAQKCNARIRNVEWCFTLEEWIAWWGDDFSKRGRKADQLCMARNGDTGPYHPDNVRKLTMAENHSERNKFKNPNYLRNVVAT